MVVDMKTQLRQLREVFECTGKKVSQEAIARKANITLQGYRNVENGGNTSLTTATAILAALNEERLHRGMNAVGLSDLGLKIV
jgi:DNA-binding XRE family transcriptional regulator